jgi:hypothetical protein
MKLKEMKAFVKHLGYKSHKGGQPNYKGVGQINRHIKYIEHRMDEHGIRMKRELFNKDITISREEFMDRIEKQVTRGVIAHKLVISMDRKDFEQQRIDLKELTRDTMIAYEAKLGRDLNWIACLHDDKESNPHAHIVIAGRDDAQREVAIKPHELNNLKRIADQQRQMQFEIKRNREIMKDKEIQFKFDFDKQLERELEIERSFDRSMDLEPQIIFDRDISR